MSIKEDDPNENNSERTVQEIPEKAKSRSFALGPPLRTHAPQVARTASGTKPLHKRANSTHTQGWPVHLRARINRNFTSRFHEQSEAVLS
jgi:hypothetical protein